MKIKVMPSPYKIMNITIGSHVELSIAARGLWFLLMSRINEAPIEVKELHMHCSDTEEVIQKALDELIKARYAKEQKGIIYLEETCWMRGKY